MIERAKEFDGQEVIYQGEAIGEVMIRGDYGWINLHDGQNAIGVWAPRESLGLVTYVGNYKAKGDWIEVKGIFSRACNVHGADLDIHAASLIKAEEGRAVTHRLVPEKKRLVVILSGVLLCLLILQLLKKMLNKK